MTLLLAFLLTASRSYASQPAPFLGCAFQISPPSVGVEVSFSNYVTLKNGHELFVQIEKPAGRKPAHWFFDIHGLLETHRSYDALTEHLIALGYGVVRPDLYGFGRSLLREIQTQERSGHAFYPRSKILIDEQTEDMTLLLEHLRDYEGITKPDLVGHSMGGAIALATAASPRGSTLVGERVTGVAPYIYRVDFDMIEYMMYLGFNPLIRLSTMAQYMPSVVRAGSTMLSDGFSEPALRSVLNRYFDERILTREFDVDPAHRTNIRHLFVSSAIAAKRGLEEFSAYPTLNGLPAHIRYDLVFGEFDTLIRKGAALQFGERVSARGGRVLGLPVDHDVLEKQAESLARHVTGP